MGILRTDKITGLGSANATTGSVFFSGYVDGSSADWLQIHDNLDDFAGSNKAVSILTLAEGQFQDAQVVDKEINFMAMMIKLLGEIK